MRTIVRRYCCRNILWYHQRQHSFSNFAPLVHPFSLSSGKTNLSPEIQFEASTGTEKIDSHYHLKTKIHVVWDEVNTSRGHHKWRIGMESSNCTKKIKELSDFLAPPCTKKWASNNRNKTTKGRWLKPGLLFFLLLLRYVCNEICILSPRLSNISNAALAWEPSSSILFPFPNKVMRHQILKMIKQSCTFSIILCRISWTHVKKEQELMERTNSVHNNTSD